MRVWFQDESRFGLITETRRRIGIKSLIGNFKYSFKYFWLYGLVEPLSGESYFWELPHLNSLNFQIFLEKFSENYPNENHLIFMDGAGAHTAKKLKVPKNIILVKIPAYSPELNPIERLWQDIKKHFSWQNFNNLSELSEKLSKVLKLYSKEVVKSITSYSYIEEAFN